jgi:hypothetical protein
MAEFCCDDDERQNNFLLSSMTLNYSRKTLETVPWLVCLLTFYKNTTCITDINASTS